MSEKQSKRARRITNGPKACVMCARVGKRSEEHIFPQWLLDSLGVGGVDRPEAFGLVTHGSSQQGHTIDALLSGKGQQTIRRNVKALKARVVCEECNKGWMSGLEQRLSWLKQFILAGRGRAEHEPGTYINRGFAATFVNEGRATDLALWSILKALTLALAWAELGRIRLDPDEMSGLRSDVAALQKGDVPPAYEVEAIMSYLPGKTFQCGLIVMSGSIVFCIRLQQHWIRVIKQGESKKLLRLALLGPLLHPWKRASAIATIARVEEFVCRDLREEMSFLLEGVVVTPSGHEWGDYSAAGPMPMTAYREFIPRMRELTNKLCGQSGRPEEQNEANGDSGGGAA